MTDPSRVFLLLTALALTAAGCKSGDDDDDSAGEGEGEQVCEPRLCDATGEQCCDLAEGGSVCKNLNTAFTDCGACGSPCDGEVASACVAGECACGDDAPCAGGASSTCCAGQPAACVDLTTDDSHCGECGQSCIAPAGQAKKSDHCFDGACVCGDTGGPCTGELGSTCCADEGGTASCHNIVNEIDNCGDCGNACDPLQGNICYTASCVCGRPDDPQVDPTACLGTRASTCCAPADDARAAVCADLDTNPAHCGECNNACAEGQTCVDGNCE